MRSRPMPVSTEGFGRGSSLPLGVAIELHEDEIPDFDVAAAVAGKFAVGVALSRRLPGPCRSGFRCTGRRAGVAHGPEIFFEAGNFADAVFRRADFDPERCRFVIAAAVSVRRVPRRRKR